MNISDSTQFGNLIRERRERLLLSQEDIAGVIGVNRRVVGELERGKPTVRLSIALEIAQVLGLDIFFEERER